MSERNRPRVRAVRCSHLASDSEVYDALERATRPLEKAWERLEAALRITVKFNQAWSADEVVYHCGQFQELVDPKVARAVLRLLRERTTAEILCTEISVTAHDSAAVSVADTLTLLPVLREYEVSFADGNQPPHKVCPVPGGGQMFHQYLLPECVTETDAFVSVQKMKNHLFMGVTLCLKNLFGLPPQEPYGRARQYFHHLVRLPHVLVDLGRIVQPTMNIIDALVGQSGREWGGKGHVCDTLVAGDHVISTDACGAYLMGHNPLGDWPEQPFLRERNAILIAHESGFGTADLDAIDFQSEADAPVAPFATDPRDPLETIAAWHRSTCEQALYYRDHHRAFLDKYAGEYILLQDRQVRWHGTNSELPHSRRELAGGSKLSALWFKRVDPEELEGEHYEVYERTLSRLNAMGC